MNIPNADDSVIFDNQELIKTLDTTTDATIKASADLWSKGIAALFVIVGAGAWIAGPTLITGMDSPWRWLTLSFVLVGLVAQLMALGYFLFVSAGTPTRIRLSSFSATNTVREYLEKERERNAIRIEAGRRWGLWGLVPFIAVFVIGIVAAPNGAQLMVTTTDGAVCGVVKSADGGEIVLDVAGMAADRTISLADVVNLEPVIACG